MAEATRKLVKKVLTFEVFRRDVVTRKSGPALVRVKGLDALREFFKSQGTALVEEDMPEGFRIWSTPAGWDYMIVGMENHFDDGSMEGN